MAKEMELLFKVGADTTPIQNNLKGLVKDINNFSSSLEKVAIPDKFKKGVVDTVSKLKDELIKFDELTKNGFSSMSEANKAEQSYKRITNLIKNLNTQSKELGNSDNFNKFLPPDIIEKTQDLNRAWKAFEKTFNSIGKQDSGIKQINKEINQQQEEVKRLEELQKNFDKSQLEDIDKKIEKLEEEERLQKAIVEEAKKNGTGKKSTDSTYAEEDQKLANIVKSIQEFRAKKEELENLSTSISEANKKLNELKAQLTETSNAAQTEKINEFKEEIAALLKVDISNLPNTFEELKTYVENFNTDRFKQMEKDLNKLIPSLSKVGISARATGEALKQAGKDTQVFTEKQKDIEQLANRFKYFFSITNSVQLFKRAVKSAINTIKELDEVMTQTAVVTKYTVNDMWKQLPKYAQMANELGVSLKGVYEASTLYYQQGLSTEQVMGVTTETLKMAKIAAIDYATATDYMTSALRGFNMEVNELSAQKVNDIYSQLAAKTASNVEEISTAMSKVAPLAHNAGMEIETTAAMLAQMIEKTREAPETLGTAMKTVIARFQELKKAPSEIEEIDGEIVDANKVEAALRTVGISLRDTSGQFRELDDVFLELSSKWDTLDINTQRYIATIAAGSRQQSRFIAMMADYKRTMELVTMANNSAGASQEQFEKTQESMATALERLKIAWQQFTMGLANNQIVKFFINLIADLIKALNYLIKALSFGSGIVKSFLSILATAGGLKLAKTAFNAFFSWLVKNSAKQGTAAGKAAAVGFEKGFNNLKKLFKGSTWISGGKGFQVINKELQQSSIAINDYKNKLSTLEKGSKEYYQTLGQLGNATKIYNGQLEALGANIKLTNSQQAVSNLLQEKGVDISTANLAAVGGLTEAEINKITVDGVEAGLTQKQIIDNIKAAAAKKANAAAEGEIIVAENLGILTRIKYIAALLFGNKQQRADAFAKLGMAGATYTATAAQNAFNASLYACPLGLILLGIAALITLLVVFIKLAKNTSLQAQMDKAAKATKQAKEAADKAKEAYDNLLSNRSEYNDLQQQLEDLTYGTQEWKEALLEVNQEVLKLIQEYPELAKYIGKGAYGQLIISDEGWDEQVTIAQQRVAMTSGIVTFSQARERALENESAQRDFNRAFEYFDAEDFFVKAFTSTLLPGILDLKYAVDEFNNGIETGKTFGASRQEDVQNDLLNLLQNRESLNVDEFNTQLEAMEEASHLTEEQFKNATTAAIEYNNALEESKIIAKQTAKAFLEANLDYKTFSNLDEGVADKITNVFADYMNSDAFQRRKSAMGDVLGYGMASYYQDRLDELAKQYNVQAYMKKNDADQNLKVVYAAIMGLDVTKLKDIKATKVDMGKAVADAIFSSDVLDKLNSVGEHWEQLTLQNRDKILLAASQGESYRGESEITKDSLQLTTTEEQIVKDIFGSIENFVKEYNKAIEIGSDDLKLLTDKIENKIGKPISEALADLDLDNNAKKALGNKLLDVFKVTGAVSAQELSNTIFDIFGQLETQEDIYNFARAINSIDWTDAASINTLSDTIKNLGLDSEISIDIINDLEKQVIKANKALSEVNFEQLEEQLKSLGQIAYNLGTGKQSRGGFSEEDRNLLIEKGIAEAKDFVFSFESGDYTYVGDSIQDLIIAINANTDALLGEANRTIDQKISTAQAAYLYSSGEYLSEQERKMFGFSQGKAVKDFVESGYGPYSKDYLNGLTEEERESAIKEIWDYMVKEAGKIETYQEEKDESDWNNSIYKLVNDYRNNPMGLLMTNGDKDTKRAALVELATQAGVTEDAITSLNNVELASVIQSVQVADGYEIEREELDAYAKALKNTDNAQVKNLDDAYKLAVANKRLEKGYTDLKDSGEKWYKILSEATDAEDKASPEYLKASEDYRKAIQNIINADTELSEEWVDKNIENLNKAIQGDKSALDEIVISAIVETSGIEESTPEIDKAISEVLNNYQDIKIGGYVDLNTDSAIVSLYNFLVAANKTVPQIQALFDELGWEADIDYIEIVKPSGATVKVPKSLTSVRKKTAGPAGVNLDDLKDTGSGGGGGSEPEWENPYDRLYSLIKEINSAIRLRNKLEQQYQRMLNTHVETGRKLKENIDAQIESLQKQNQLQRQLADERMADIQKIQNQSGLKNYAWFDEVLGEVQIDWDLIQKVDDANNEELGERIEDYISKLEEWVDSWQEANDAFEDNLDTIIELQETGKDEYKDLEDRALEAIIGHQQKIIDEQEETNKAIDEANSALTDAISKNIEKMRQDRQNEEKEQSLAEKERRLAYLRQDTTGSNALEIKKLEKDLDKERQDYTDSLIDQSLNDLKEQNDAAAKQREKQIELMQSQLNYAEKTGVFADQATDLVKKMLTGGVVDVNSDLYKLLVENEDYYKLTNASRKEWFEDLQTTIAKAFVYDETVDSANIMESMISAASSGDFGRFANLESQRNAKIRAEGLQDQWPETHMYDEYQKGYAQAVNQTTDYMQQLLDAEAAGDWAKVFFAAGLRDKKIDTYSTGYNHNESFNIAFEKWYKAGQKWNRYATGGMVNYTGPAWLDGTKSKPEAVLNAADTQNFIELRDVLASLRTSNPGGTNFGDMYFDIDVNVDEIASDYDVDSVVNRIKQSIYEEATYRNVNAINFMK